jgi:YD repeat-containing protein
MLIAKPFRLSGFVLVLVALLPSVSHAQGDKIFDAAGFQQSRDYFGTSPSEHIDMLTGSLVLTYTDLVLPGNAGQSLRFGRVFNSKERTWSFSVSAFPTVVADPYTNTQYIAPKIYDESGAVQPSFPLDGGNLPKWIGTTKFWKFDHEHRVLYFPSGAKVSWGNLTSNWFDAVFRDPFGNIVTMIRSGSQITVTQYVGDDVRTITLTYSSSPALLAPNTMPIRMTYAGRVWDYSGTQAIPPVGPPWSYSAEYTNNQLTAFTETNPHGGTTRYEFEEVLYKNKLIDGSIVDFYTTFVKRKIVGGRGATGATASRTWTFTYNYDQSHGLSYHSTIQSPTGVLTDFTYKAAFELQLPGAPGYCPSFGDDPQWVLDQKTVIENGTPLERETRRYWFVCFPYGGSPEMARRDVERDGRLYRTDYKYSSQLYGDFHRPYQIIETGELTRTTTKAYEYDFTYGFNSLVTPPTGQSSIVGEITGETVTVNNGPLSIRTWTYDLVTGFLQEQFEDGIVTKFTPSSDGHGNVGKIEKNGTSISYDYRWGVVSSIQTPMYVISRIINPEGTVASETRGGRTTSFRYDNLFRIVESTPPGNTNSVLTDYDNAGGSSVTVTRGGIGTITYLDGFGRSVGADHPGGIHTRTDYDLEGRKVYDGYPIYSGDRGTTIVYDALNRVTRTTHPDSKEMRYTYSGGTVIVRDENLRDTVQNWSAFGNPDDRRLVRVTDAKLQQWNYEYTDRGNLHKVISPDGVQRVWNYDGQNRLASESQPESGTTSYSYYSGTTLVSSKTDGNAVTTTFSYDDNGRVSQMSGGGKTTTFTYHPGMDLKATISAPSVDTTFDLDAAGRVYQRRDTVGVTSFTQRFDYDPNDNLSLITYADGRRVQYNYDGANRISRVFDVDSGEVYARDFGYHASGALETFRAGNELVHTTTYDTNRYWPRTMDAGDLHLTYDNYDGVGNVRTIGDSRSGQTQTLVYDELDRLVSAGNSFYNASYAYDAHGNRQNAGGTSYSYQPGTLRLTSQSSLPGVTFGYDNNGNMTSGFGTFTYSADNLVTSSTVQGTTATFLYDAEGWRVRKTVGSLNTSYLRGVTGQLLTEWSHAAVPNGYAKDYIYAGSRLIAAVKKTFTQ